MRKVIIKGLKLVQEIEKRTHI